MDVPVLQVNEIGCAIWWLLHKLKNAKNILEGVLLLVLHGCFSRFLNCTNSCTIEQGNSNILNPFQANVPFLYPLKTLENLPFSDVFRWYRKGKWPKTV